MRVLHLNDLSELTGGREVYLADLVSAWNAAGHYAALEADVATLADPARLQACIRRHQPDIIHVHTLRLPAALLSLSLDIPLIKTVHAYGEICPAGDFTLRGRHALCERRFGPYCLAAPVLEGCNSRRPWQIWKSFRTTQETTRENHFFAHFVTASAYVRERLLANGFAANAVTVVPYAIADHQSTSEMGNSILFVGRLYAQKGLHLLLEALRQVPVTLPLRVVGDGSPRYVRELRTFADQYLPGRVEWLGWRNGSEKESLYRQAAVVVVPSLWPEPFGIVGIEAMRAGKPVVAFSRGGIPEWLDHGRNGLLIDAYDVDGLGQAVTRLANDGALARQMGAEGRAAFQRTYRFAQHIPALLKVYERARSQAQRVAS